MNEDELPKMTAASYVAGARANDYGRIELAAHDKVEQEEDEWKLPLRLRIKMWLFPAVARFRDMATAFGRSTPPTPSELPEQPSDSLNIGP